MGAARSLGWDGSQPYRPPTTRRPGSGCAFLLALSRTRPTRACSQQGLAGSCFTELLVSGFPPAQVKIWFQNRRMKWRNSKERELLSSGGCREQTLPTKFNPHPDLSDVGKKCAGEEEEEEEAPTTCLPSPRHPLSYHQSPEHLHLRDRLDSQLPPSPSHSSSPSKPSDFSDSEEEDDEGEEEEEEITVS